jgi:hypothetical protein
VVSSGWLSVKTMHCCFEQYNTIIMIIIIIRKNKIVLGVSLVSDFNIYRCFQFFNFNWEFFNWIFMAFSIC